MSVKKCLKANLVKELKNKNVDVKKSWNKTKVLNTLVGLNDPNKRAYQYCKFNYRQLKRQADRAKITNGKGYPERAELYNLLVANDKTPIHAGSATASLRLKKARRRAFKKRPSQKLKQKERKKKKNKKEDAEKNRVLRKKEKKKKNRDKKDKKKKKKLDKEKKIRREIERAYDKKLKSIHKKVMSAIRLNRLATPKL